MLLHGRLAMRLDKFISNNTRYSRSDVRRLIKSRSIELNGERALNADIKINARIDTIFINGDRVEPIGKIYLMLHKPEGYVCANKDSQHPTVIDLLRQQDNFIQPSSIHRKIKHLPLEDMQIAGRLDIDTTGLVLITTDGNWNHKITAPSADCKKVYKASLAEPIAPHVPAHFSQGIQLEGESKLTRPAIVQRLSSHKVKLTISEGKYHQVKRMFAAVGNCVTALHRESIGGVQLDTSLKPGQFRQLTEAELKTLSKPKISSLEPTKLYERGLL